MFNIIPPDSRFDFMSHAKTFGVFSAVAFVVALVINFSGLLTLGLDFSGGHEILLAFDKPVEISKVRAAVEALDLGDSSVQSFEIPNTGKTHYLVRVQRAENLGDADVKAVEAAIKGKYGEYVEPLHYNKEIGNVVEVQFTATATAAGVDTSTAVMASVIEGAGPGVRGIKRIGREDSGRFSVTLVGVDAQIVEGVKSLDPGVTAPRVGFVGPTVGKQLRNDGILASIYALLWILVYIALRFDFFYGPGAVLCLFHDAVITVAILGLIGHEFSLATIAGILTLIGYSINDTIVIFDRVRETVGKVHGSGLKEVLNRAINETLGRTVMTSLTTLAACLCLMTFGRGTILFDFGLIMAIGVVIGTYSTIFVASPIFMALRLKFGPKQAYGRGGGEAVPSKSKSKGHEKASPA